METIWDILKEQGLSGKVSELLLRGERRTTAKAYQPAWRNWCSWCDGRKGDPLSATINDVLEYLAQLFEKGLSFRTIGVHLSMLSSTLAQLGGPDVGNSKLVCRLMKAIFNHRPPRPRYEKI